MRTKLLALALALTAVRASATDILLKNVVVYDGSGTPGYAADVRIHGDRITALGRHLTTKSGEATRDGGGLALAPGFIDMHSHGDRGRIAPGYVADLVLFDLIDAGEVTGKHPGRVLHKGKTRVH